MQRRGKCQLCTNEKKKKKKKKKRKKKKGEDAVYKLFAPFFREMVLRLALLAATASIVLAKVRYGDGDVPGYV